MIFMHLLVAVLTMLRCIVTAAPVPTLEMETRDQGRPLLLRATEVAVLLSLSKSKVHEMMAAGELPCVRIGRAVRCPRIALERWIADHAG